MLKPQRLNSSDTHELSRLATHFSDFRSLNYMVSDSLAEYAASGNQALDCNVAGRFSSPMLRLMNDYRTIYSPLSNDIWRAQVEQRLGLYRDVHDIDACQEELLQKLSGIKLSLKNPKPRDFLANVFSYLGHESAVLAFEAYIETYCSDSNSTDLQFKLKMEKQLIHPIYDMANTLYELTGNEDFNIDLLKYDGKNHRALAEYVIAHLSNINLELSTQIVSSEPKEAYINIIRPLLPHLLSKDIKDFSVRLLFEYFHQVVSKLDPEQNREIIIDAQCIVELLSAAIKLKDSKANDYKDVLKASILSFVNKLMTVDELIQVIDEQEFETFFAQHHKDLSRGGGYNGEFYSKEQLERQCFDLTYNYMQLRDFANNITAFVTQHGVSHLVSVSQELLAVQLKKPSEYHMALSSALAKLGVNPEQDINKCLEDTIRLFAETSDKLQPLVDTEELSQHIERLQALLPFTENNAMIVVMQLLTINNMVCHQLSAQMNQVHAQDVDAFLSRTFTLLMENDNPTLQWVLLSGTKHLFDGLDLDDPEIATQFESLATCCLAFQFVKDEEGRVQKNYHSAVVDQIHEAIAKGQFEIRRLIEICQSHTNQPVLSSDGFTSTTPQHTRLLKDTMDDLGGDKLDIHAVYRFNKAKYQQFIQHVFGVKNPTLFQFMPLRLHQGFFMLPHQNVITPVTFSSPDLDVEKYNLNSQCVLQMRGGFDQIDFHPTPRGGYGTIALYNYHDYFTQADPYNVRVTSSIPGLCAVSDYATALSRQSHGVPHRFSQLAGELVVNDVYMSDESFFELYTYHAIYGKILPQFIHGLPFSNHDFALMHSVTQKYIREDDLIDTDAQIPVEVLLVLGLRNQYYFEQIIKSPELLQQLLYAKMDTPTQHQIKSDVIRDYDPMHAPEYDEYFPEYRNSMSHIPSISTTDGFFYNRAPSNLAKMLALLDKSHPDTMPESFIELLNMWKLKQFRDIRYQFVYKLAEANTPTSVLARAITLYMPSSDRLKVVTQVGKKLAEHDPEFLQALMLLDRGVAEYALYHIVKLSETVDLTPVLIRFPDLWASHFDRRDSYFRPFASTMSSRMTPEKLLSLLMNAEDVTPFQSILTSQSLFKILAQGLDQANDKAALFVPLYMKLEGLNKDVLIQSPFMQYVRDQGYLPLIWIMDNRETDNSLIGRVLQQIPPNRQDTMRAAIELIKQKLAEDPNPGESLFQMQLSQDILDQLLTDRTVATYCRDFMSMGLQSELHMSAKDQLEAFIHTQLRQGEQDEQTLLVYYDTLPEAFTEAVKQEQGLIQRLLTYPKLCERYIDDQINLGEDMPEELWQFLFARLSYAMVSKSDITNKLLEQLDQPMLEKIAPKLNSLQFLLLCMQMKQNLFAIEDKPCHESSREFVNLVIDPHHQCHNPVIEWLAIHAHTGNHHGIIKIFAEHPELLSDPNLLTVVWNQYLSVKAYHPVDCLRVLHHIQALQPNLYLNHPLRLLILNNAEFIEDLALNDQEVSNEVKIQSADALVNFLLDEQAIKAAPCLLSKAISMPEFLRQQFYWLASYGDGHEHTDTLLKLYEIPQYRGDIVDMLIRYPNMQVQLLRNRGGRLLATAFDDAQLDAELKQRLAIDTEILARDPDFANAAIAYVIKNINDFSASQLQEVFLSVHPHYLTQFVKDPNVMSKMLSTPCASYPLACVAMRLVTEYKLLLSISKSGLGQLPSVFRYLGKHADIKLTAELVSALDQHAKMAQSGSTVKIYRTLIENLVEGSDLSIHCKRSNNHYPAMILLTLNAFDDIDALITLQQRIIYSSGFAHIMSHANSRDLIQMVLNHHLPLDRIAKYLEVEKLLVPENQDLLQVLFQSPRFYQLIANYPSDELIASLFNPKVRLLPQWSTPQCMALVAGFGALKRTDFDVDFHTGEIADRLYHTLQDAHHFDELIDFYQKMKFNAALQPNFLRFVTFICQRNCHAHRELTRSEITLHTWFDQMLKQQLQTAKRSILLDPAEATPLVLKIIKDLNDFMIVVAELPDSPLKDTPDQLFQALVNTLLEKNNIFKISTQQVQDYCEIPSVKQKFTKRLTDIYLASDKGANIPAKSKILARSDMIKLMFACDAEKLDAILSSNHFSRNMPKSKKIMRVLLESAQENYDNFRPHAKLVTVALLSVGVEQFQQLANQPEIKNALREEERRRQIDDSLDYDVKF